MRVPFGATGTNSTSIHLSSNNAVNNNKLSNIIKARKEFISHLKAPRIMDIFRDSRTSMSIWTHAHWRWSVLTVP
jgi:hypothetical protein